MEQDIVLSYWIIILLAGGFGVSNVQQGIKMTKGKLKYLSLFEQTKLSRLKSNSRKYKALKKELQSVSRQKQIGRQFILLGAIYLVLALIAVGFLI